MKRIKTREERRLLREKEKADKAEALEESFRHERNTRWAKHKGIDDVNKWYNEGNRMPRELELDTIELKKKRYLLSEIFELFDKREEEAKKRAEKERKRLEKERKRLEEEEQPRMTFSDWFIANMEPGMRAPRSDIYMQAICDGVYMIKKDFFKQLEEKCGKPYKSNGVVYYKGWSLKQPTSSDGSS